MHSSTTARGNTYNHNGDYSGEVRFAVRVVEDVQLQRELSGDVPLTDGGVEAGYPDADNQYMYVEIPFADMLELVMDHLASRMRQRLEMADTNELIEILVRP